jgi:hypothetical protein
MEEIPSKSRVALKPLLSIVRGARSRTISDKESGTRRTRQQHFLKFLNKSNLGNNISLSGFSQNIRNIIMACYTADLASGQNILCISLKSGTILRYLATAAELSLPHNQMNPCLDIYGKRSKHINNIINEIKRWENIPNRREPVSKQMIDYIASKGKKLHKKIPDNIYLALSDWLILGMQSGFRRKEWAQENSYLIKHKDIQRNVDGSSAAFIMNDFEFRGRNNTRINQKSNYDVNNSHSVNLTWRFQKNNDNGQIVTYVKDTVNKAYCYVSAAKRIRLRAIKYKVQEDMPVAIYNDIKKKKKVDYINDINIKEILQEAAKHVYNISKKEDLMKFTSHSIRVMACVILHAQNMSTEDIKFRLRWRSESSRIYLRNITEIAERHKDAISKLK